MSTFDLAIPTVLRHEGGYVNNINDPGGATNFGVSLRWLKAKGLLADLEHEEHIGDDEIAAMKLMNVDQAKQFYLTYWWTPFNYASIIAQMIATKVFDTSVNMGASRAHKFAQAIVGVPQDGIIGPKTIAEINAMSSLNFIVAYQNMQAQFYRGLVTTNPARQEFLKGWLARAYDRN
jgi:lysozyme family protein